MRIGLPTDVPTLPGIPTAWIVVIAALVLAVIIAAVAVIWPKARHWARSNRLHKIATSNGAALKASGLRDLNEAIRTLESARRACIAAHRAGDASDVDALVSAVALVRDRVASDYVPTPPNAPLCRRDLDLTRPEATAHLLKSCARVARTALEGQSVPAAQLGEAQVALRVVDRDLALQ